MRAGLQNMQDQFRVNINKHLNLLIFKNISGLTEIRTQVGGYLLFFQSPQC
jgi:hypothetical protein